MLTQSITGRLRDQLASFQISFASMPPAAWDRKPASGKWSARENLAHLARYHQIFLDRLRRILNEDCPRLARYRAEQDQQWPSWESMRIEEVRQQIPKLRASVIDSLTRLSDAQLARTGIHPALGEMNIPQWIEFFLIHEAHHLYAILFRLREPA